MSYWSFAEAAAFTASIAARSVPGPVEARLFTSNSAASKGAPNNVKMPRAMKRMCWFRAEWTRKHRTRRRIRTWPDEILSTRLDLGVVKHQVRPLRLFFHHAPHRMQKGLPTGRRVVSDALQVGRRAATDAHGVALEQCKIILRVPQQFAFS